MTALDLFDRPPGRVGGDLDVRVAIGGRAAADDRPKSVAVYLVEAAGVGFGAGVSEPVTIAMEQVAGLIECELPAPLRPAEDEQSALCIDLELEP
jgi:hypothetical protein